MGIEDFQDNSNSILFLQNTFSTHLVHYLSILLVNLFSYLYIFLKFYKVICYSKMTFEWLPMINPYHWPFSFFQLVTDSYFKFWSKMLPTVRFEQSSLEISGIIALEALNSLIYLCVRVTQALLIILEETNKLINTQ